MLCCCALRACLGLTASDSKSGLLQVWAEIGGKEFFAQQACVDKIRHAVGQAVELLPDMFHLGPDFTEIYSDGKAP